MRTPARPLLLLLLGCAVAALLPSTACGWKPAAALLKQSAVPRRSATATLDDVSEFASIRFDAAPASPSPDEQAQRHNDPARATAAVGATTRIPPTDPKVGVQRDATEAIIGAFADEGTRRATAVLPGGSGKTVLALRVLEALASRGQAQRTLVLLTSLDLVSQTLREWRRWGVDDDWEALAVCSSVSEAVERTTDPEVIARFLAATHGPTRRVVFSTYHSADKVAASLADDGDGSFDLMICDEAHVTAGRGSKRFARPLDDGFLSARRRLFLTATPRIYDGIKAGASDDDDDGAVPLVASMDDPAMYGRYVYRLSHADAVRAGVVAPLQLVFLNTTEAYERLIGNAVELRDRLEAGAPLPREHAELALALFDCYRRLGVNNIFSFHSRNERAEAFESSAAGALEAAAATLDNDRAAPSFATGRVHGKMPANERRRVLAGIRADRPTLITNSRVLTTGVDVPAVDLVVFADAKQSHVEILQAMARAARVSPGKECGYVLVPTGEEDEGAHSTAVDVMRACAANDDELLEALQTYARDAARLGRPLRREEWPAPMRDLVCDASGRGLPFEQMAVERMVGTVVRELTDLWERNFGLLTAFRDREAHCDVPQKHEEQGVKLGLWLTSQRLAHGKGTLDAARRARLEALGVVWDVQEQQWDRNFELLTAFRAREAHCDVPTKHEEQGVKLGWWLTNQRTAHGKGMLSAARGGLLEALGVVWDVQEQQLDRNFELLTAFRCREAHCDVPQKHEEQGVKLGTWLNNQRTAHSKGTLDAARRARLEALGVVWDAQEQQWERNFELLTAFRDREAHCDIPLKHEEQGVKLGTWLTTQRTAHSKGTLDAARRARLEALGVVWDAQEQQWERGFELLTAFRACEAHCDVPQKHEEQGVKLGLWLKNQRTAHSKGTLDAARRARLEALGVVWDPLEQQWERGFELLTAFRDREAHCDVPQKHEEQGVKLGAWLKHQRTAHGKGTLEAARRARLEARGVVWDVQEKEW